MRNKIATPLGTFFSTNEKIVSQHEDQALEATTKPLVISFDQEKFKEILSQGAIALFLCASTDKSP